ncbi:MAG: DUF2833 domain-containing protein [Clostridia bacterium]|nr:DUF2833 domain-containing protein [Clostridia bacterium]
MYYDKDGYKVRKAKLSDVAHLAQHMRSSDVAEIWASDHKIPEEALREGLERSIFACTVENGVPIAMFGICPLSITGDTASVWLLATDDLDKLRIRFAKNSRKFVEMMLEYYPYLENMVDDRNTKSIEWLRFCGAKIDEPVPYGEEQLPFRHFSFTRGK